MVSSKQFYNKLTPEGLAKRKEEIHTYKEIYSLKKKLSKKDYILDVGCGYGRFTILLANAGYKIEGVDITPSFILKARKEAKKNGLQLKFKIGDMKKLPYQEKSFDAIICMWSVFMEIPKKEDQLKVLREIIRVLRPKGYAIIELPKPYKKGSIKKDEKIGDILRIGKNSIITGKLSGIGFMPSYRHDRKSLTVLMKKVKIKNFKINIEKFGGRYRLFLQFWKN